MLRINHQMCRNIVSRYLHCYVYHLESVLQKHLPRWRCKRCSCEFQINKSCTQYRKHIVAIVIIGSLRRTILREKNYGRTKFFLQINQDYGIYIRVDARAHMMQYIRICDVPLSKTRLDLVLFSRSKISRSNTPKLPFHGVSYAGEVVHTRFQLPRGI